MNEQGRRAELVLYATEDGRAQFFLRAEEGTVWMTQLELAELFQTSIPNVNIHISNVLEEGELADVRTVKEDLIVQTEGTRQVRRSVKLYNLDMILAIGYRVKSPRGTQFRQWATVHLRECLVKGFVMDDERLKGSERWDFFFRRTAGAHPGHPGLGEALLPEGPRAVHPVHRLCRRRPGHRPVLRRGAEPDVLRRHPPHGGRTGAAAGRSGATPHGAHLVKGGPRAQGRRDRGQELPEQ